MILITFYFAFVSLSYFESGPVDSCKVYETISGSLKLLRS